MTEMSIAGKIPKNTIDEDGLLVKEAQRNPQQFKKIYQKWLTPVYRYFYFRVGNVKDAEDLTAQVFLRIYESLPRYENRGCFSAWLFSVAHARMVDFYRRDKKEVSLDVMDMDIASLTSDENSPTQDDLRQLLALLKTLNEEEQELIRLRFFAGLSFAEIGLLLNRKEDTVRKSVSRLLNRLQSQMEVHHDTTL